jgi:hypothetical protein
LTISSQTREAGPFVGNGTTTVFPFAFKVFQSSDLYVVRLVVATGVQSTLIAGTDYTVVLNSDQNASPGGTVTVPVALATGYTLTVTSLLSYLQATDLTNAGGFYPSVINDALDRLTIFVQQLVSGISRSLRFPLSDGASINTTLPGAAARAGKVLTFDSTGAPSVVDNAVDVTAVAANAANINIVSTNIASVNTDAANIASINTAATNIVAIQNASANATAAANSATAASGSATAAATSATNSANSATAAEGYAGSVKVTTSDTTPGVLNTKVLVAATLTKTTLNPGANENLQLALNMGNVNAWTAAQRGAVTALTYGATVTPDFALSNNYSLALTGNVTLANPTNLVAGQSGIIAVSQDATGSRTIAFGSYWKFTGGTAPTLTTTASAIDDIAYYVESATRIVAKVVGDTR